MRLLLTTLSLDAERGGGTAQRTTLLARYLRRAGARCRVVAIEDGVLAESLREEGVDAEATRYVKAPYHLPFLRLLRLDRYVEQADALHILGYWNLLSVYVAWRARRHRRPYLLSVAGELTGLASAHLAKQLFHRLFGRRMLAGARALVAITELERRQIMEEVGLAPDRVFVLPNAVEPPAPLADPPKPLVDAPYVLFVGRLTEVKGPDLLLEAFARIAQDHADVHLVFAGPDFGLRATLEARSGAMGLQSRVHFPGFLDAPARQAAYEGSQLLVVPSRDEAMSLVALEAGVLGRPVLLTDRCGFDAVGEVGGGCVVSASVDGLAAGLESMLGSQRGELDRMGATLRDFVVSTYAWSPMAERLLAWLEQPDAPVPHFGVPTGQRSVGAVR
ncbi:MAG: glycosyltransferase [Kiloniellales bacterium]